MSAPNAREPGRLYGVARVLASVGLRSWFRLHTTGAEHVPEDGPAIVAANHKSFLDAFFVGLSTRRRVHFMAKSELFRPPQLERARSPRRLGVVRPRGCGAAPAGACALRGRRR